jgi:hypothetical protein
MQRGLITLALLLLFNPQVQNACGEVNPARPDRKLIRKIKSTDGWVALWLYLQPAPDFVQTQKLFKNL